MAKPVLSPQDAANRIIQTVEDEPDLIRAWDHPLTTYSIGIAPDLTLLEDIQEIGTDLADWIGPGKPWPNIVPMTADGMMQEAVELWDDVMAHNLERNNSDDAHITINFISNVPAGSGGYTKIGADLIDLPTGELGDYDMNQGDVYLPPMMSLSYADQVFGNAVHEIGHALGLRHPGDYDASDDKAPTFEEDATFAQDTRQYTVMSYFGGAPPQTPMVHDILAVQSISTYGVDTTTRTGNTTYGFNTTADLANRQVFNFNVNQNPLLTIWDAGGNDTLDVSGFSTNQKIDLNPGAYSNVNSGTNNVGIAYGAWIENAVGGSGNDEIHGNISENRLSGNGGNDKIFAGDGADALMGGAGDDELFGGEHRDTLFGDDNNDTLNGEGGDDIMWGGNGNDVYVVTERGDQVLDVAGATGGLDKVYTTLNWYDLRPWDKGGSGIEELQFVGTGNFIGRGNDLDNALVGGAGDDSLHGNNGNDILVGGEGRDTLRGGDGHDFINGEGGADSMYGGTGNDTYVVNHAGDRVFEDAVGYFSGGGLSGGGVVRFIGRYVDAGIDTVETELANYTLPNNVENLTFTYFPRSLFEATGTGNALNNVMRGGIGRDTLYGLEGNDTLDGGLNGDHMAGGRGDDTYYVDDVFDLVDEQIYVSSGASSGFLTRSGWLDAGSANDHVITTLSSYDLSQTGSHLFAVLGAEPRPIYGTVENLTYSGTGAFTGTGNAANNIIRGSTNVDLGDVLSGGDGNDQLYGLGGGDRLIGGAGADGIDASDGDDTAIIDNGTTVGGDVVLGGFGYDQVWADASVAASGLRLNLFASGTPITAEVNLVRNTSAAMDVELVGGSTGNDLIDASRLGLFEGIEVLGLAGDDTFVSGLGSDTFWGGENTDTVVFSSNRADYRMNWLPGEAVTMTHIATGRVDTLHENERMSFADGTFATSDLLMAAGLLGTEGPDVLRGDENGNLIRALGGNDELHGLGGSDTLDAGDGDDRLFGGPGGRARDTFLGGAGNDTLFEVDNSDIVNGGEGYDFVYAGEHTAAAGFRFTVAGTNVEYVDGGEGNDVIDASGVTATIPQQSFGDGGNDVLIGGAGIDWLVGGRGSDTGVFAGNRADYTLTEDVDNGWTGWTLITHNATGVQDWVLSVETLKFADMTIAAPSSWQEVMGTGDLDTIDGTDAAEEIYGLGGNDRLGGGGGNDLIFGGLGADEITGGAGSDVLYIDNDDTLVEGGEGYDYVYADDSQGPIGLEFTVAGTGVELVFGGLGHDRIDASGVSATDEFGFGVSMVGNAGNDVLIGSAFRDYVEGGDGYDTLVLAGVLADYTVGAKDQWGGTEVTHIATGAVDWVYTVETLQFSDSQLTL